MFQKSCLKMLLWGNKFSIYSSPKASKFENRFNHPGLNHGSMGVGRRWIFTYHKSNVKLQNDVRRMGWYRGNTNFWWIWRKNRYKYALVENKIYETYKLIFCSLHGIKRSILFEVFIVVVNTTSTSSWIMLWVQVPPARYFKMKIGLDLLEEM